MRELRAYNIDMNNNTAFTHARNVRIGNRMVNSILETVKTLHIMEVTEVNAWKAVEALVDLSVEDCVAHGLEDEVMHASMAVSQLMDELWA